MALINASPDFNDVEKQMYSRAVIGAGDFDKQIKLIDVMIKSMVKNRVNVNLSHERKDIKIIAFYWLKKGWKFANKEQFESALQREFRPAKALKGYSGQEIAKAFQHCQDKYPEWSLETAHKRITDLINKQ